jgi:hypothetical protein
VPSRRENVRGLFQEFDRDIRCATFEADSLSIYKSQTNRPRSISVIRKALDGDIKRILSGVEWMVEKVKLTGKKRQREQRAFIERLIERVVITWASFGSMNHACSEQDGSTRQPGFLCASLQYAEALYQAPGRSLPTITSVSRKTLLLFDRRGEKFDRRSLAITLFTEG